MTAVLADSESRQKRGPANLPTLDKLLERPPDACPHVAGLWKESLGAPSQPYLPWRELFAYWIGHSVLHEVERAKINEIYAGLDSHALKALSRAVQDLRKDPEAVESYVERLREAERIAS
jgi:hypothetical protein